MHIIVKDEFQQIESMFGFTNNNEFIKITFICKSLRKTNPKCKLFEINGIYISYICHSCIMFKLDLVSKLLFLYYIYESKPNIHLVCVDEVTNTIFPP